MDNQEQPQPARSAELTEDQIKAVFADHRLNVGDWSKNEVSIGRAIIAQHEAQRQVGLEPVAWRIKYKSPDGFFKTVLHGHNAVGDYRQIDPQATSEPLYAAPRPPTAAEKALREVLACIQRYMPPLADVNRPEILKEKP